MAEISANFKLQEKGRGVTISGKTKGIVTAAVDGTDLVLLPAFISLSVDKIKIEKAPDPDVIVPILNELLRAFLSNINGKIVTLPNRVPIKIDPISEIDLAKQFRERNTPGITNFTCKPIIPEFHVKSSALLFDTKHFQIIMEMQYGGEPPSIPPREVIIDDKDVEEDQIQAAFEHYTNNFMTARDKVGTSTPPDIVVWAAIRKSFLSKVLNEALDDISIDLTYDLASIPKQTMEDRLAPFDHSKIDCTPKRDCSLKVDRRDCSGRHIDCSPKLDCSLKVDRRDCSGRHIDCGRKLPWEKLACEVGKESWKKACEAAKASKNGLYAAEKGACEVAKKKMKADCEVGKEAWKKACEATKAHRNGLYAAEKAKCELAKSADKAKCEAGKEIVKRLENSGPLGDLTAEYKFKGTANLKIDGFKFTDYLSSGATEGLNFSVNTQLYGSVGFMPMGIVGHGVCLIKWKEPFKFIAQIESHRENISWEIETAGQAGSHKAVPIVIKEQTVGINVRPAPVVEIFFRKPHLLANCPFLVPIAAIFDLSQIAQGEKDSGMFTGDFSLTISENRDMSIPIEPMTVKFEERTFSAKPAWEKDNITFTISR
jgi:hypothetical protein